MDTYIIVITIIGLAALGMAWMPVFTKKTNISYAVLYVLFGALLYMFVDVLPLPDPIREQEYTVRLTEMVVIISLMGTGLKIDQPFSLKGWRIPFRLISITMLLSIGLITLLGWWGLKYDIASALLLGAVLAPTDPVLASDVQVGPPNEKKRDEVKFALTAEAGLNDGMAFPFTWMAVTVAFMTSPTAEGSLLEWFTMDFLYRIGAGFICGYALGRLLAYLIFKEWDWLKGKKIVEADNAFIALATTLLIYGLTEMIHGYGFMAVFVGAVTLRNRELRHEFHTELHSFTDQIERILVAIVLILFGGSLITVILDELTWEMALYAAAFVLVVRPLSGYIGLMGSGLHMKQKLAISFFGIKGIGSFFYLAFALEETDFLFGDDIWSLVAFTVLISLVVHGITARFSMKNLEEEFAEDVSEDHDLDSKVQ
ncbi:sodium:proton antiporter [Telluribacter sp.]|jgi:NhaP-type Na+/H+ or K+/H+ antiporter|uniref:cation:proton antiporter n=1 Tax=Telluribacter sp. TaxID=1978767 RepID=UPI002E120974|nr:sodium:proton antiporter [Telluribacter sp.]